MEKKKLRKRRDNVIGESFAAPKQLNEPQRVDLLREHSKQKAEELLAKEVKKKAKQDAEEPVAKGLKSLGYLSDLGKLTVASMKAFLRRNSALVQMPKSATHPKKEDLLAFLTVTFSERASTQWVKA